MNGGRHGGGAPDARRRTVPTGGWKAVLFPAPARPVPHERWINIALRSGHIVSSGVLLGGHVFGISPDQLFAWLIATVATGLGLIALDLYRSFDWFYLGQGVLVVLKVLLTAAAGLWWDQRVGLLVAVALIGSLGSHMPSRYRHYSLLHRREMRGEPRRDAPAGPRPA